jgi:hypothetical protein
MKRESFMATQNTTVTKRPYHRKLSLTAGLLYLLTFVSIPTLAMYSTVKSANFLINSSSATSAIVSGLLEITVALAGIGTAVVLFPILKKQNESAALGLVAARILESGAIFIGVACLSTIVAMKHAGVGADGLAASHTLVALYDRIFLLSQSFMPAICDLLLGFMLLKSRLVPKGLAMIGIVGAPLLLVNYIAVLFGGLEQHSKFAGISSIGVAVFEFSLGLWLVFKGFNAKAAEQLEVQSASKI